MPIEGRLGELDQLLGTLLHEAPFDLPDLVEPLQRMQASLVDPMRVTIVGDVKAGKSTSTNALVEEEVAPVGTLECTFNVTWLRRGADRRTLVHYLDGTTMQLPNRWRVADVATRLGEAARGVDFIQIQLPSAGLRLFDLVDTPGLSSVHRVDSENTQRFLQRYPHEALVCAFSQGIHEAFMRELQQHVRASGHATPLNAVGVLTQHDRLYWPETEDPLATATGICRRLKNDPAVQRCLFEIVPVSAQLARASQQLTDAHLDRLGPLCRLAPKALRRLLENAERFRQEDAVPGLSVRDRLELHAAFGAYGLWLTCRARNEGRSFDAVRQLLADASGLPVLRDLLENHFGRKAATIKWLTIVHGLRQLCLSERFVPPGGGGRLALGTRRRLLEQTLDALGRMEQVRMVSEALSLSGDLSAGRLELATNDLKEMTSLILHALSEAPDTPGCVNGIAERLAYWQRLTDYEDTSASRLRVARFAAAVYRTMLAGHEA